MRVYATPRGLAGTVVLHLDYLGDHLHRMGQAKWGEPSQLLGHHE